MTLAELELESDTTTVAAPSPPKRRRAGVCPPTVLRVRNAAGVATSIRAEYGGDNATVAVAGESVSDVFLSRMRTVAESDIDAALDLAFRRIDEWLRASFFERCDHVLQRVDAGTFHEDLLVGLLTITFAAKDKLPARARFLERSALVLRKRLGEGEAARALNGLA